MITKSKNVLDHLIKKKKNFLSKIHINWMLYWSLFLDKNVLFNLQYENISIGKGLS